MTNEGVEIGIKTNKNFVEEMISYVSVAFPIELPSSIGLIYCV